ncbi:DEKNAAC103883 [Brettanomyces naardenensis]|uniref:DEKNAAC103883 n=1 Tax=Brettanomyces naardenensis TaxID=13370 RepID=A0A448YPJ3_BRENA|nr:DEKNAAC103883 [Brettanomyces naardenensis]
MSYASPPSRLRRSVYQTNGRPLSEEAIYKAKQKYGYYQGASRSNPGVDSYASDTAALLAASSDLSVHPYERQLSAEAATAALYAKTDSSPSAWKRRSVDPNAEYAAISAKSQLPAAPNQPSNSLHFDIGTITKAATEGAARSLSSRLQSPNASVIGGNGGGLNISRITSIAEASAKREIADRLKSSDKQRSQGIPTASDSARNGSLLASRSAAASQTLGVVPDYAANERDTLKHNTLVTNSVLALATKNANDTLNRLDADIVSRGIFSNKELNQKALQVAMDNAKKAEEERGDTTGSNAKINLGGGLFMTLGEISLMAASVVQPALAEIDKKANLQRESDKQRAIVQQNIKLRKIEWKEEVKAAKEAEKQKWAAESSERRVKLEGDKGELDNQQKETFKQLSEELTAKEQEFDEQVAAEEAENVEIDTERAEKLGILNDTKAQEDAQRAAEFEEIRVEKEKDLAPITEELTHEKETLAKLTADREEKEAFHNEHKARFDAASLATEQADHQIAKLSEQLAQIEKESSEATEQATKEIQEASEKKVSSEQTVSNTNSEVEKLEKERADLEKQRDETESRRVLLLGNVNHALQDNHSAAVEINDILPDHLKKDVPAVVKAKDDIEKSKYALNDKAISLPPEVESEPEDIPDKIWNFEDEKAELAAKQAAEDAKKAAEETKRLAEARKAEEKERKKAAKGSKGLFSGFIRRGQKTAEGLGQKIETQSSKLGGKVEKQAAKFEKKITGKDKATPVKATPVQATPVKATPVKSTPVKATPVKATSAKATPVKAAPETPSKSGAGFGRKIAKFFNSPAELPAKKLTNVKKVETAPSKGKIEPTVKPVKATEPAKQTPAKKEVAADDNFSDFSQDFVHVEKPAAEDPQGKVGSA